MARGADDSASGAVGSGAAGRGEKHGIVPGRGCLLYTSKTLGIAQELYEKKLVTYPRTGSRYIPQDLSLIHI